MRSLETFTPANDRETAAMELSKQLCFEGGELFGQGRHQDALEVYRQDMVLCGEVCGRDHNFFANSLYDMASCYYYLGQFDFALLLLKRAARIHELACGADHRLTLRDRSGIGHCLTRLRKHDEALAVCEALLAVHDRLDGEDNETSANLCGHIADLHIALEQREQAVPFLRRKLAITEKISGAESGSAMNAVAELAANFEGLEQYRLALPLRQRVLAFCEGRAGESGSRELVDALRELALNLGRVDKRDLALAMLQRAEVMNRQIYEREVRISARHFAALADAHARLDDMTNAYRLLEWDVRMRHDIIRGLDDELHMGALDGQLWRAKKSLEYGAAVNHRDEYGRTALFEAARSGYAEIVRLLIEYGAEVNVADHRGNTPLLETLAFAHREVFELLVEHGADTSVVDADGRSLAMECCINNADLLERVLEFGPDLEQRDRAGKTALILAAEWGTEAAVALLIARGARLDATDADGCTALMYAARGKATLPDKSYVEIVTHLLAAGAAPELRDHVGKSALDHACEGDEVMGVRIVQNEVADRLAAVMREVNADTLADGRAADRAGACCP